MSQSTVESTRDPSVPLERAERMPDPSDTSVQRRRFTQVVDALCTANEGLLRGRRLAGRHALPSRDAIDGIVSDLRAVLFPSHFGSADLSAASLRYYVGARLDKVQLALFEQVRRGLAFECHHGDARAEIGCLACDYRAREVVDEVVSSLPRLRALLETDVQAAYDGDPAAKFPDETLFCYPGVAAITAHRFAHELHRHEVPLIPRIVADLAHGRTGIDIHPGATIGQSFFIDHGTGVVIGETCRIGDNVRIYQGVTLGARGVASDGSGYAEKGLPRHPIVENDVVIYAGATILGRITIGRGSTIGGNVWLTRSVPPGTNVSQAHARQQRFIGGTGI